MLSWLDASGQHSDEIEFAIWFHDAIYDPLDSHNEAQSAQYFADRIGSFVGGKLTDDVERLVVATDPKRSRSGREDEDLIIDIDLSILGSEPEDYEAYQTAVRREYSSVPEAQFSAGRRSILQSFLCQRIYATEFFSQLEEQARSNIKGELEALQTGK
ncbi:MAG: phosphohydrolase [Verrucomicrobiota bacterium]